MIYHLKKSPPIAYPQKETTLYAEMLKTTHYGIQSIKYLAPKIWDLVPDQVKHVGSLTKVKHLSKFWSPSNCLCRLCKTYIAQVGFI